MRITIDNLDGLGPCDYTAQVCEGGPISIARSLNRPSTCTATLLTAGSSLALPVRKARVIVTAEDPGATVLFTGYVTRDPALTYAGRASEGPVHRAAISAVSDEWLLDRSASGASLSRQPIVQRDGRQAVNLLVERALAGSTALGVSTTGAMPRAAGPHIAEPASSWSGNAARVAGASYAAYRAIAGDVLLQPAATATLTVSDSDGTFSPAAFAVSNLRELANDVTLTGETEPASFITETFCGDGATTEFVLRQSPFRVPHPSIVDDAFAGAAIDPRSWTLSDPGSHIGITSAGLTVTGGTGFDGQTMLTLADLVELGGTLVAEASSVQPGPGCNGMLLGFYQQPAVLANCFAGFRFRQQSGIGNVIVPVLNGVEVGTVFTALAGHRYKLRLRLHCVEVQRVRQLYYALVDGVVENFGSLSGLPAPMDVVFEILDEGAASNTPATVLYDSATATPVAVTPAACMFVAINSAALSLSIGAIRLTRTGTLWITSTSPSGVTRTRLAGLADEGVDCVVGAAAGQTKLTFLAGRTPVTNERLSVQYRSHARAVARLQNAASVAAEAAGGAIGTCRWLGKVVSPPGRSSEDCESAAMAVLAIASSPSETLRGSYATFNPPTDVWPGDLLAVQQGGVTSSFLVRSVAITDGGSVGEVRRYLIHFANDWGTEFEAGVGLQLSEAIAPNVVLPQVAQTLPAQVAPSLQALTVTAISTTTVQLDMGISAPVGGGFEIRRRDADFNTRSDGDLVVRTTARSITLSRGAQIESLYIRAYDNSTPRRYSRFSAVVLLHWPVS